MKKTSICFMVMCVLFSIDTTAQGLFLPTNNTTQSTPSGALPAFWTDREIRMGFAEHGNGNVGIIKFSKPSGLPDNELGVFTWAGNNPVRIGGNIVKFMKESGLPNNVYVSGNMGINTLSPNARLELNSGVANTSGMRLTQLTSSSSLSTGNGRALTVDANGDVILTEVQNSSFWSLNGGTNDIFNNNPSGNVGIGLNTPTSRLEVLSSTGDATLRCTNTNTAINYASAIEATANTNAGEGLGGVFRGGKTGVEGWVEDDLDNYAGPGIPSVEGVAGFAANYGVDNDISAIGVLGQALSLSDDAPAIGLYGIATASDPNDEWALFANGRTFTPAGNWTASDERLKKNIQSIESALEVVNQLQPKTYEFRNDGKFGTVPFAKGKVYGFLAQELENVIPEMVTEAPIFFNSGDADKSKVFHEEYKAVSYQMLIPVLTQAIKEQQQEIVALRDELMEMKETISRISNSTNVGNDIDIIGNELMQNAPNPFSVSTVIPYKLSSEVANAYIYITDLNGKLIKKYNITSGGPEGEISIAADNLADGMYIYTLIANDHVVDSKRMIVAK